ncbi:MAG: 30S ribosome-binding factor RbfA [Clostridia bacterium]|nr:30S ribosome-binding factor RbfA [Clostridia bacterium]
MDRTIRIAGEMQRALSEIIQFDMKDPRIPPVTGVTKVKLTKDLQFAKVYVSMFASAEEKKTAVNCLASSEGFIRSMLGKRMIIRQLPRLTFRIDNSAEEGEAMSRRIDEVMRSDAEALAGETGEPREADGNASETHDN